MPALKTRADSLWEYLTGAGADGGAQADPLLSLGNFRSSTQAPSFGISIANALANLTVDFASGGNNPGAGTLTDIDANNVAWQDFGEAQGAACNLPSNGSQGIAEASGNPGAYLRLTRTSASAISGGPATVTLSALVDNFFSFDDVSSALATSGEDQYRATIIRNEAAGTVNNWKRWLATLGSQVTSNGGNVLSSSGAGTISTTGSFSSWPTSGCCHIKNSSGVLKEVVYYSSRTDAQLTVPTAGRGILGTSQAAGAASDLLDPIPGVAIGLDPAGVLNAGSAIETIANQNTAPAGVTWNVGITPSTGLSVASIAAGKLFGFWMWRHIVAGSISTPSALVKLSRSFDAA